MKLLFHVLLAVGLLAAGGAQAQEAESREVTTAAELQQAVADGVPHVVITSHLSLDSLESDPSSPLDDVALVVSERTLSIQVCPALRLSRTVFGTRSRAATRTC